MMPKVTRLNDLGSMHQDYPNHPAITASSTVFVNGIGVVRVGDIYAIHSNGKNSHSGNLIQGSPNVFIENKAVGRIGDAISCGGVVLTGSPNVNVNNDNNNDNVNSNDAKFSNEFSSEFD